jgi:hypothetical protein
VLPALMFAAGLVACIVEPGSVSNGNGPPPAVSLNAAPVIDSLEMPSAASVGPDGYYTLAGTMSFHDDDSPVHFVRVFIPTIGKTYDFPAGDQQSGIGSPFAFKVIADIPLLHVGVISYDVSLVDTGGAKSAVVKKTVDLQ